MAYLPVDFVGTTWGLDDGDVYIATNGNDITGDGSPSNPYASFNKGMDTLADLFSQVGAAYNNTQYKLVIGSGVYEEHYVRPYLHIASAAVWLHRDIVIEGDGNVIFEGKNLPIETLFYNYVVYNPSLDA